MNTKPALWDKDFNSQLPLRKPKVLPSNIPAQNIFTQQSNIATNTRVDSTLTEPNTSDDSIKRFNELAANSTLKADAPEWYPNNVSYKVEAVPSRIQNRLKVHKSQSDIQSPSDVKDNSHELISNDNYINEEEINDFSPDIKRLKQIISTLTMDPGQFDNLLDLFMETLMPYMEDFMALSTVAQILVEQGINNSNFRYSGAKLCWFVEQSSPEFRAELPLKCKKQLEENVNIQNVVLFIAELYAQLPYSNVYGSLLIDSFNKLFTFGGNDNIKCICQALKLTGYSLEESNKADLNVVMKDLDSIKGSITGSTLNLLNSVLNLRQNNWGHSTEVTETEETDEFYYESPHNTIIYEADGQNLTTEESSFIAAHFQNPYDEFLSDTSNPDELCDPEPEMDEEIQADFKEFLKYSSKQ